MIVDIPKNYIDHGRPDGRAIDHWLPKTIFYSDKAHKTLKRWGVTPDTPVLGSGGSAVALLASPQRVVKITSSYCDAVESNFLARLNRKVPHLVRVFEVVKVPEVRQGWGGMDDLYMMKLERLHTRVHDLPYQAAGSKWQVLNTTFKEVRSCIEQALKGVGLSTSSLGDFGPHNVMFDNMNRPTWYDFGCGDSWRASQVDPKCTELRAA